MTTRAINALKLISSTKSILNSHFNTIVRIIQIMEPHHPGLFPKANLPSHLITSTPYNKQQYYVKKEFYDVSHFEKERFVGEGICGEAIFACKFILETYGNYNEDQIHVWLNKYGSGRRSNDHCFLTISAADDPDQKIIIDPTAKQFWQKEFIDDSADMYTIYLQCILSPFFVGTENDLKTTLLQLYNIYNAHHLNSIEMPPLFTDKYWNMTEDITHKFDLSKCLSNYEYLKEKPTEYQSMVRKIAPIVYTL